MISPLRKLRAQGPVPPLISAQCPPLFHPSRLVCFLLCVGKLSSAQAPSGLVLYVRLKGTVPFIREVTSLIFLSSLQFQITRSRTSFSGEKRLDLDLGFWVEMNQESLWVACLPLPPELFSKIPEPTGSKITKAWTQLRAAWPAVSLTVWVIRWIWWCSFCPEEEEMSFLLKCFYWWL